jgi:hypothetical protein
VGRRGYPPGFGGRCSTWWTPVGRSSTWRAIWASLPSRSTRGGDRTGSRGVEIELAIHRRASELIGKVVPKRRYAAIAVMAGEGLPVQMATGVLGVSRVGLLRSPDPPGLGAVDPSLLAARPDPPGARRLERRLRCPAGARRAHPRPRPAGRAQRGRDADGPGRDPRRDRPAAVVQSSTGSERQGPGRRRLRPDRAQPAVWVTDITEHPTRQGKVYCAVVPTPTPAGWWAGQSTPRRPPPWSPTR